MWAPGREPVLGANTPWSEAIDHPGAFQMGHVRRLFESRPWETLEPDQALARRAEPAGRRLRAGGRGEGPLVRLRLLAPGRAGQRRPDPPRRSDLTAWWFDPRYGRAYFAHTGVGTAIQVFTPPSSGRGCDWVLVLDDAAKGYPPPGEARR